MIRPQQKRQKEQRDMINAISKDDEVITSGGILGKVVSVTDNVVVLQIANNVEVQMQKSAIVTLLPKGTLDAGGLNSVDKLPPSCCG
jgi:preprotein translocase subunit YajC